MKKPLDENQEMFQKTVLDFHEKCGVFTAVVTDDDLKAGNARVHDGLKLFTSFTERILKGLGQQFVNLLSGLCKSMVANVPMDLAGEDWAVVSNAKASLFVKLVKLFTENGGGFAFCQRLKRLDLLPSDVAKAINNGSALLEFVSWLLVVCCWERRGWTMEVRQPNAV